MSNRFVDDEELVGKTIAKVRLNRSSIDILFTDGTYTSAYYGGGYYLGEQEMSFEELGDADLRRLDEQEEQFKKP